MKEFEFVKKSKKVKVSITIDHNIKKDFDKYISKEVKKQESALTFSYIVNEILKNYLNHMKESNSDFLKKNKK